MNLLIKNAEVIVTLDEARRELRGGAVMVQDRAIAAVGSEAEVAAWVAADPIARAPGRTLDARGCVLMPGLVNGHHHMFQSLTRAIGTGGGLALFDWLKKLFPIWHQLDPDAV